MHYTIVFPRVAAVCLAGFLIFAQYGAGQAPAAPKAPGKSAAKPAAKPPAAKPAATPIEQIKRLVSMKLPDQAIVNQIRTLGAALKASPEDLIALKEMGASDAVLVALSGNSAASPAPAAAGRAPAAAATAVSTAWNTDLSSVQCQAPTGAAKRVLAVDEFDYGTIRSAVQAIFGTDVDIGKGIQALMVKRLAETGEYRVVERRNLAKVMAEQDLGASSRAKQGTGARIGRIKGADAILMGTITVFGRDDKRKSVDLGGYAPSVFGRTRIGFGSATAVVSISYRLVDAETSEIINQGEARGESKRKANSFSIAGGGSGGGGGGATDMSSSNFAATIVGEATIDCVNQLAAKANGDAAKVQRRSMEIEARIADVSGARVYIAAGGNDGVTSCDRFEVFRIRKEIIDPATKEVIDFDLEKVGDLLVTEVRDRVSICAFNGTAAPEPKMLVRKLTPK